MFRKKDWREICQTVNNGDPQVAGLWVLWFFCWLFILLCTFQVLYKQADISQISKKIEKGKFSELSITSIFCGKEESLPYFKYLFILERERVYVSGWRGRERGAGRLPAERGARQAGLDPTTLTS